MHLNIAEPRESANLAMRTANKNRTPKAIGQRLIATRQALDLTQRELCRRTGIAPNTYNQWEAGRSRPLLEEAMKLVDALDLSLDWIYRGDPGRLPYDLAVAIAARSGPPADDP